MQCEARDLVSYYPENRLLLNSVFSKCGKKTEWLKMKNVSMGIIKLKGCLQNDQHFTEKGYSSPKNYLNYF